MPRIEFPISGGFYEDSSKPVSSQMCENWIPVVPETDALSQSQLKGTPGISEYAEAGNKINRGMHVMNSIAYSVNGNNLYRINSDGTEDDLGSITGSGRVSMADNGTQLIVVIPDSTGYIFTEAPDTLTIITDVDYFSLGPSKQVGYKDGFFVHIADDLFYHSNLNDGLVYDSLDFGTAEVDPDNNTAIHVNRNILYIGGNETIEPFQNIGGSGFVFQRIPNAVVQKGIKAKFSVIEFDNSFVFLGGGTNEQPSIWRFTGDSAIRIATQAIDNIIGDMTDAERQAVFATSHAIDGAYFVSFHFSERVFTYDATSSALLSKPIWFERKSRVSSGVDAMWRVHSIVEAYGVTLVGDNQSGSIGKIDPSLFTEYGNLIDRNVSFQPFKDRGRSIVINQIEVTVQSGSGNTVDPGSEPMITLSISRNGGFTFGNELSRSMGKTGEYGKRQIWWNLGQVDRFAVFKLSVSDPVQPVIIKLEIDFDEEEET